VINFDIFVLLVAKYTQKVFYKLMLELWWLKLDLHVQ
jgi:hypothetical protein